MNGYGAYDAYRNNSILTANQGTLVLKLYEGALRFIHQGAEDIDNKNVAKAHENITKAQKIIMELRSTLDHTYPIAAEMDRLYEYIYDLLVQANMKKDKETLLLAGTFVKDFRETWQQVLLQKK